MQQHLYKHSDGRSSHGSESPQSGSAADMASSSDADMCTVVIDEETRGGAKGCSPSSSPDSVPALAAAGPHQRGVMMQSRPAAAAAAVASKDADAAAVDLPLPPPSRPRTYYVDWLRVFLTVLVVVHHCVLAYQSSYAWHAKKGDTALFLFSELFVAGNQAYFMTLFFFLSGLYVPGSYRRKGALKFLLDRTLRLVVPCIVYSFIGPPFILWWNEMAKNPAADPGPLLAAQFKAWLTPTGWPTTYVLPTGPPWFVWMLWCFNVAYVILKAASSCEWLALPVFGCCGSSSSNNNHLPKQQQQRSVAKATFSTRQMLAGTSLLGGLFFVACFGARMLNYFVFSVRPFQFVQRGPFVSFMPDLFPTYVLAFALGIYGGPSGWDVLARLPDAWGSWALCVGGVWWLWAGWLVNIVLRPMMVMQRGVVAFVCSWLLRTFVEQSFCVVWSIGLLVVFRQAFNAKPGLMGRHMIAGAYAAYLVHPLVLILFARVIMAYPFPSAVVNAAIISLPSVVTSWLLAIVLRMLPGAHHIL